jgi:hypothetical protein
MLSDRAIRITVEAIAVGVFLATRIGMVVAVFTHAPAPRTVRK